MLYQKHLWYNTGTPGFGFARSDASIPKIYMLDHGWWWYNTGTPGFGSSSKASIPKIYVLDHGWWRYNTGTPGFGSSSKASIPKIYMLDHGWWGYNTGSPADLNLFLSLFHMIHANHIHLTIQTLPDIKIKS